MKVICVSLLFLLTIFGKGEELAAPELISFYVQHTEKLDNQYALQTKKEHKRYLGLVKKSFPKGERLPSRMRV